MRFSGLDALRSGVLVALTATATFSLDVPAGLAAPTVNSRPAASIARAAGSRSDRESGTRREAL